jgi:hypothetical protein
MHYALWVNIRLTLEPVCTRIDIIVSDKCEFWEIVNI